MSRWKERKPCQSVWAALRWRTLTMASRKCANWFHSKQVRKVTQLWKLCSWLPFWWTWYSWGHSWPVAALHREPLQKKMTNKGQETETLLICWLMLGIVLHVCLLTLCLPTVLFVLCLCCRHLHSIDLKAIRDLRRQAEHSSLLWSVRPAQVTQWSVNFYCPSKSVTQWFCIGILPFYANNIWQSTSNWREEDWTFRKKTNKLEFD